MGHVITDTPKIETRQKDIRPLSPHPQYHSLRIAGRKAQGTHNSKWKNRMHTSTFSVETPSH